MIAAIIYESEFSLVHVAGLTGEYVIMGWFNKTIDCIGAVFFRGTALGRPEEFSYLKQHGIELKIAPGSTERRWEILAVHPHWGEVQIQPEPEPPHPSMIEYDLGLSNDERHEAIAAGVGVRVRYVAQRDHLLRDRKCMLRFLRAIMGDDGVVAMDLKAYRMWSRPSLDEELEHDADLDISQICAMHAVYETPEDGVHWLHTHGLGEIGYFDFDVLFPSEEVLFDGGDVMRAIAFAIAEGEVKSDTPRFQVANPRGNIAFCPSDRFQREAAAEVAALRTVDDYHSSRRSVICEPVGGLLSRFHKAPRFSRFLSEKLPPNPVIRYSAAATELMADRAAKTYQLFCRIYDDLSDIALPTLVKLGYPVDNGDDGENEHLWFQVESLNDRGIDAILLNSPYQIAGMKEGDRKIHSMELLTDWTIISPLGNITPRSLHNFRAIEPAREALKAMFSNRGQ